MFDNLSDRLGNVFDRLKGRGALSESDVREAMREIRIKRKGVERHFQNTVAQFFANPPHAGQLPSTEASPQASADTLSLVGNDDLEEQVAIRMMRQME